MGVNIGFKTEDRISLKSKEVESFNIPFGLESLLGDRQETLRHKQEGDVDSLMADWSRRIRNWYRNICSL